MKMQPCVTFCYYLYSLIYFVPIIIYIQLPAWISKWRFLLLTVPVSPLLTNITPSQPWYRAHTFTGRVALLQVWSKSLASPPSVRAGEFTKWRRSNQNILGCVLQPELVLCGWNSYKQWGLFKYLEPISEHDSFYLPLKSLGRVK